MLWVLTPSHRHETIYIVLCYRVVIPLCGGNIDSSVLARVIDRGLAIDRRLCSFEVVVSDRPGGISELTEIISQNGARYSINYFQHTDIIEEMYFGKTGALYRIFERGSALRKSSLFEKGMVSPPEG